MDLDLRQRKTRNSDDDTIPRHTHARSATLWPCSTKMTLDSGHLFCRNNIQHPGTEKYFCYKPREQGHVFQYGWSQKKTDTDTR